MPTLTTRARSPAGARTRAVRIGDLLGLVPSTARAGVSDVRESDSGQPKADAVASSALDLRSRFFERKKWLAPMPPKVSAAATTRCVAWNAADAVKIAASPTRSSKDIRSA